MANIAGVNIPEKKKVPYSLTYIYGIGLAKALEICNNLKIDLNKKVYDLNENELAAIRNYIDKNLIVENELKRNISDAINNLIAIRCYRGNRHRARLPVRGQRTHSNAETRRSGKA